MTRRTGRVVFIHSSNEMFGADRMLLQVVESLRAEPSLVPEVWLPTDAERAADSVEGRLAGLGVATRVVSLPILRRRHLTPLRLPGLLARTVALWARLVAARPAIVYCTTSATLLAAPAARLAGCRSVVLHDQEIWAGSEARVLGWLASACTAAVAISTAAADSLRGPIRARAVTVRNAVPDRVDPAPSPVLADDGPLRFLVASRWNSWKGHGTLLAAWDSLPHPPGILYVVGSPPEQGIGVDVAALVDGLSEPRSVTIVGQVADITEWIDRSDFMIVPSDDPEPFGLVAIEAFGRCRAVIASSGGGLGEIVTDGVDGLLFENRSVEQLAGILGSVDRETAIGLGTAARATFVAEYSIERFDRAFAGLWRDWRPGGARLGDQSRLYSE